VIPFNITSNQAIQEILEFNNKLARGLKTLADISEIDIATTPREAVYQEDKLTLYRYKPIIDRPQTRPLLIVYALVNRPYMLDLQPDRSLIKHLLEQGLDIYLIDWGYPEAADRYLTLEDYINGYLHRCVKTICKRHGIQQVNLLGVCQGGTLSLCYSALHPQYVSRLITMVTPVDFKTSDNLLSHWLAQLDVDLLVETLGNIPGEFLNWAFLAMKPFHLTGKKYLDMIEHLEDEAKVKNFLRMEKWIFDSPDQVGETFRQFIKEFFQKNNLLKGRIKIGEQKVDLRNITMPVLNIYANQDHLVPPQASKALKTAISSQEYSELIFIGGHIGIYVSQRAQQEIPPAIAGWLNAKLKATVAV